MDITFGVVGLIIGILFGLVIGTSYGIETLKAEAFERGHMVECLGKAGYYWECEE